MSVIRHYYYYIKTGSLKLNLTMNQNDKFLCICVVTPLLILHLCIILCNISYFLPRSYVFSTME